MYYFERLIKKILYYFGFDIRRIRKRLHIQKVFGKISELEGDIVECGVGQMGTFQIIASLLQLQKENSERKLWGFDSFEGFPEPSAEDISPRNPQKGELKYIEAEDVAKFLLILGFKKAWVDSNIKIVKGFFQDTLPNNNISKIAFLHLDVDLYDSYKTCLRYLFPKVVEGGVVLFDEYANADENHKFPGAKKAIDEYFSGTKYKLSRDRLTGKYFLIKK